MTEITLTDGRKLAVDLTRVTLQEWRDMLDPAKPEADGDAVSARLVGMTAQELVTLPFPDFQAVYKAMWQQAAVEKTDSAFVDGSPLPVLDFKKITGGEWRVMTDAPQLRPIGDAFLAALTGLEAEAIPKMTMEDFRRLWCDVIRRAKNPLANPT